MKSAVLFIALFVGICVSIYFSYTHLVLQQDYETFNSEEEEEPLIELEANIETEDETEE